MACLYRLSNLRMHIIFISLFQLHVHDSLSLDGFVSTVPTHPTDTRCPGVYALDCEMVTVIEALAENVYSHNRDVCVLESSAPSV